MRKVIRRVFTRSYEIFSRLIPNKYYPYKFAGGRIYLNIKESPKVLVRALGKYEVSKMIAIKTFLLPGGTFIDIGAEKGYFSLLAARTVGDNGTVLSFEPEPTNCHWIRKSIYLNGYQNIALYECALSDKTGQAKLYLSKKSGWHSLVPGIWAGDQGVTIVKIQTLDNFLKEIEYKGSINMIKIDVEAAEMQVLRGASQTLSTNKNIIVLIDIHPLRGVDPKDVCNFLEERGFSLFQMKPPFDIAITNYTNLKEVLARRI